jgi:hypothetical protein
MEKDNSRSGGQNLFFKLAHAGVARGALRDPQEHGMFSSEDRYVNAKTLDHVCKQFASRVEQKKGAQSGQFFPHCAEKPPDLRRVHCPARLSLPEQRSQVLKL